MKTLLHSWLLEWNAMKLFRMVIAGLFLLGGFIKDDPQFYIAGGALAFMAISGWFPCAAGNCQTPSRSSKSTQDVNKPVSFTEIK